MRTPMTRTEDRHLIAGLQARDEAAVHELAERYGPRIYQLALRQTKNPEDAEEVTQDVLLKVYRKIGAFRGDSALSSWIYRITFNTAMSRLRTSKLARAAQHRERTSDDQDEVRQASLLAADWSPIPNYALLLPHPRRAAMLALPDLPELYRVS